MQHLRCLNWLGVCGVLLAGCGESAQPSISGVSGTVLIDSQNATPGTTISFFSRSDESNTFTTVVGEGGRYEYKPSAVSQVAPGEFVAVVRPVSSKTVQDAHGMTMSVPIPGAPKSYGKYSDVKKSDLTVNLTPGKTEKFDIAIQTHGNSK
ncbi:hypothetical protein SH661x_002269 [Planctomicrobium sp. SH661]|uniref:hypothetical protein n=1 Tax=Planctomicrobium sp. SH661 TaxID=3448124 RepID=UPI003F5C25AF